MTVYELKIYLLEHISDAVEVPAISCSAYTKRQIWTFYNEFCDRQIRDNPINHKAIIAESMRLRVLQDFGGEEVVR